MNYISIRGARTHNLKDINVDLPRDKFIVITGLSGSGKSSLAFDTLYAEGQRRYVESLSAYARQFLSIMEKPDVDVIEGLSPAISIEQKRTSHNPRSTVGTITEIYDYLRLLFARVGQPCCPVHKISLNAQTISQMTDQVFSLPLESKVMILAPVVIERKGEHIQLLKDLQTKGFVRARIDGEIYELDNPPSLNVRTKHTIEVVVDRFKVRQDLIERVSESFETALNLAEGIATLVSMENEFEEITFSAKFACSACGYSLKELEPRLFSFNSPVGACYHCGGLGTEPVPVKPKWEYWRKKSNDLNEVKVSDVACSVCNGQRLRQEALNVFISDKNLAQLASISIEDLHTFFKNLDLAGAKGEIARKINKEIIERLSFLINVGLDYLSLSRSAETLSGGEAQRIRLASQIGSGLMGVMYILDEPSIGLHQRDNDRLLKTLLNLRDLGNTVIVVEHDEDAIKTADFVLDIGPGAGIHGGEVVAFGSPLDVMQNKNSLTGKYLSGIESIEIPNRRIPVDRKKMIKLKGVNCNNLIDVDVDIPLGVFTCITGVSGSGKSSLINDTLFPKALNKLNRASIKEIGNIKSIQGLEFCDKVIDIDQSPIGRTPRSNPATYTGLFTPIRELFAKTHEARTRGYQPGRFSFNVKGGRCEACFGDGLIKVEMHFLPDIYVHCDVCKGKRYNRETLDIQYKGKNIHEVLEMTIEQAREFFTAVPILANKCQTLLDVGLSYLKLGQSATTLSGGEAQRIKLAKELSKRSTGNTLYILDEPTTGLHFHDVKQLLNVIINLRDQGNSIIIIEHNLDIIKSADWIIDLGPEGGNKGGKIIAQGTPEEVANTALSYTGKFLNPILTLKNNEI